MNIVKLIKFCLIALALISFRLLSNLLSSFLRIKKEDKLKPSLLQRALISLTLFFCSISLSEPRDYFSIDPYQTFNKSQKYLFQLFPEENKPPEIYQLMSSTQIDDYLIFDIKKMQEDYLKSHRRLRADDCFLKKTIPENELQEIQKNSKIVFSITELQQYNIEEPADPDFPRLHHTRPRNNPHIEEPADPDFPRLHHTRPRNNPHIEEPADPDFPLPAPLPHRNRPDTQEPADPDFPLPAPLPFYMSPYSDFLVVSNHSNSTVLNLKKAKWNHNLEKVLRKYLHNLEDMCDN